jgi:NAD(P)H dehydrogenase (quinone)
MFEHIQSRLLVTGAGGHLGGRVVELLLEAGAKDLVAGSRDPDALTEFSAKGAKVRRLDFDDITAMEAAFAGVERLLIISTNALAVPGQRLRHQQAAVAAAAKAGVKHLVYTSMPKPEPGSLIPFAPDHYGTEQAIEESGLGFTILRNSWYSESLLGTLSQAVASGEWLTSAGEGRTPYVAREDTARAAAAALASETPAGRRYDITGPQALTTAEIAALASAIAGKPIAVAQVSDEALAAAVTAAGVPAVWAGLMVAVDANKRAGGFDLVSDAVKQLTGKAPQALRDFLTANRAAFDPAG